MTLPASARLRFCIRDDDTCYFTDPQDLERAYGGITGRGPVSLAVIPYCRAGSNKAVPRQIRGTLSVHPLHQNEALIEYLRDRVADGRYEIMLHGYFHDEADDRPEFADGGDLYQRIVDGRRYLEELLETNIRVFIPPHNSIGRRGVRAVAAAGLHLGSTPGLRSGWPVLSGRSWAWWWHLRRWRAAGGVGVPWVLDLGDHRELHGTPVTPLASLSVTRAALERACDVRGVFCAATHYWELGVPSVLAGNPPVGEHLLALIDEAMSRPGATWCSVGDVLSETV